MDTNDKSINKKRIIGCLFAVILVVVIAVSVWFYNPCRAMDKYLGNNDYAKAVETFNNRIKGLEYEEEYAGLLLAEIEEVVLSWSEDAVSYKEAAILLEVISRVEDEEISNKALENKAMVLIEGQGEQYYLEAEANYESGEFIEAMNAVKAINKVYSGIEEAEELYVRCRNLIIEDTSSQTTEEEYESDICYLEECLDIVYDKELQKHKQHLEHELYVYRESVKIIEKAEVFYAKEEYREVFTTMDAGIDKYPESTQLVEAREIFYLSFVGSVAMEVKAACENEEYEKALLTVNTAIEEYDCTELQELKECVRELREPVYRFYKSVSEKIKTFVNGNSNFDVQDATKEAGAYVLKSGEKLVLGDYSEENITVLSLGANLFMSFVNLDVAFDLRDLVYDVQHIGEEEYVVARLATDVVALLPVVGMCKYFKYVDDIADGAKATTDVIDDLADNNKTIEQMAEAVTEAKQADNLGEAIDSAADASKAVDDVTDATKEVEYIKTRNSKHEGKVYKGVKYERKRVTYKDGRTIEGVFPVFKSKFEMTLDEEYWKSSENIHFREANKALKKQIENDKWLSLKFNKSQRADILDGKIPNGYTWHHNQKEGFMQLVETHIHDATGHTGGMSLWGIGY